MIMPFIQQVFLVYLLFHTALIKVVRETSIIKLARWKGQKAGTEGLELDGTNIGLPLMFTNSMERVQEKLSHVKKMSP